MDVQTKRVLLVDNDKTFLKLAGDWFRSKSFDVRVAESGQEALDMLTKELSDVVLLDMAMEPMTGIEVLEEMKKNVTMRYIPVFILTQFGESEHMTRSKELGAVGFLVKSQFSFKDLAEKIEKVLDMGQ